MQMALFASTRKSEVQRRSSGGVHARLSVRDICSNPIVPAEHRRAVLAIRLAVNVMSCYPAHT
jgi:hypothetical protein